MFQQIEIIFGHCCPDGKALPAQQIAEAEQYGLSALAQFFGGAHAYHCDGSYINTKGIVIFEPCTVLMASAPNASSHRLHLLTLAAKIALSLHQECVMLVIRPVGGTLQWVKPSDYNEIDNEDREAS